VALFHKIESGYTLNPSIQTIINIAEALNVTSDELIESRRCYDE